MGAFDTDGKQKFIMPYKYFLPKYRKNKYKRNFASVPQAMVVREHFSSSFHIVSIQLYGRCTQRPFCPFHPRRDAAGHLPYNKPLHAR